MALQPVTYRDEVLAAASPTRFLLSDELRRRRAGDPELTFVLYMTACAREILAASFRASTATSGRAATPAPR